MDRGIIISAKERTHYGKERTNERRGVLFATRTVLAPLSLSLSLSRALKCRDI